MNQIQAVEENALTCYKGIARLLNGDFIEMDETAWFTTGRRGLYRFNGVVRTATRPEKLQSLADPILETFLSRYLPFFWADFPDGDTPGPGDYLASKNIRWETFKGMPCMSRGLDDLPKISLPKEVELVRVQSEQDRADWLDVLMEGFENPDQAAPIFGKFLPTRLPNPSPSSNTSSGAVRASRAPSRPCSTRITAREFTTSRYCRVIAVTVSAKPSPSPPCNPPARLDTTVHFICHAVGFPDLPTTWI